MATSDHCKQTAYVLFTQRRQAMHKEMKRIYRSTMEIAFREFHWNILESSKHCDVWIEMSCKKCPEKLPHTLL